MFKCQCLHVVHFHGGRTRVCDGKRQVYECLYALQRVSHSSRMLRNAPHKVIERWWTHAKINVTNTEVCEGQGEGRAASTLRLLLRRMRTSFRLNLNFLGKFFLAIVSVFSYCEYVHYYVVLSQCGWPALDPSAADPSVSDAGTQLHAMVLADTHLLGRRNGHWFDKLRREWQMHRAFQTTVTLHQPDVFIFLGDLFDEGKWCQPEEFVEYVARFHKLFAVPEDADVLVAVGNHDIGFHYSVNPYLLDRFQHTFDVGPVKLVQIAGVTFIILNSMAMEGDECFLCKPAKNKVKVISRQLKCAKGDKEACKYWQNPVLQQFSRPVLLQHYPLYRDSDAVCDEPDEAPEDIKNTRFRERWECLSRDASEMLLEELSPRLVLSGHTHHGCHVEHPMPHSPLVHEYTIPSFSWRNKRSPTFSMFILRIKS
ncbi:metallophosphoesterase 1-like isoform X1 [Scylla paramamosain]